MMDPRGVDGLDDVEVDDEAEDDDDDDEVSLDRREERENLGDETGFFGWG